MSYTDFQRYLDATLPDHKADVSRDILPQIRVRPRQHIVTMTMEAVAGKVDPRRYLSTFEVFGYDFMVDEDFKVWLLEVNTNPCLELGCCLLSALIPSMLDNALRY
jgi:tubulin monoglycylase TTLL3/8